MLRAKMYLSSTYVYFPVNQLHVWGYLWNWEQFQVRSVPYTQKSIYNIQTQRFVSYHVHLHIHFLAWIKAVNEMKRKLTSVKELIKSWMLAFLAAWIISSMPTSLVLSPYAMFSRIVRSNNTGSWDTIPICWRSHFRFNAFISLSSSNYKKTTER